MDATLVQAVGGAVWRTNKETTEVADALIRAASIDAVVLLVRHASAEDRRGRGALALDGPGRRQARALCRVLPGFGPGRLVCVPHDRRRATLAPLATQLRLPVGYLRNPHQAYMGNARPFRELAAEGGTTVVAAPGRVIRAAITALALEDAVALPRVRARKGSVWALFFRHARLTGADYYPTL